MERGSFYHKPFGETSGKGDAGSATRSFTAFTEQLTSPREQTPHQETGLQRVHPFDPYNLMRRFNSSFERKQWNELGFQPTEEQNTMVHNVRFAYGIIAEPFCAETTASREPSRSYYQETIVHDIGIDQRMNGDNRVVLTDAEREILVQIAQATGIPCDPKRSEYFYDEIPPATWLDRKRRIFPRPDVVDAGK